MSRQRPLGLIWPICDEATYFNPVAQVETGKVKVRYRWINLRDSRSNPVRAENTYVQVNGTSAEISSASCMIAIRVTPFRLPGRQAHLQRAATISDVRRPGPARGEARMGALPALPGLDDPGDGLRRGGHRDWPASVDCRGHLLRQQTTTEPIVHSS